MNLGIVCALKDTLWPGKRRVNFWAHVYTESHCSPLGMQSLKDVARELGYSFSLKYFKCKTSFRSNSAWHWIYCFSLFLYAIYYFHLFLSSGYYTLTLWSWCALLQMCLRPLRLKQLLLQKVGPQQPRPPLLLMAPRQPVGDNSSRAYMCVWEFQPMMGESVCACFRMFHLLVWRTSQSLLCRLCSWWSLLWSVSFLDWHRCCHGDCHLCC